MIKKISMIVVIITLFSGCTDMLHNHFVTDNENDLKMLDAIQYSNYEACKEAISSGANIDLLSGNICDRVDNLIEEKNPFIISCFYRQTKISKLLIDMGASPVAYDAEGYPLICYTIRMCDIDLCQFLLDNGADINQKSDNGVLPIECCFLNDIVRSEELTQDYAVEKMFDFLVANGAIVNEAVLNTAIKTNIETGNHYKLIKKIASMLSDEQIRSIESKLLSSLLTSDWETANKLIQDSNSLSDQDIVYIAAFGNTEQMRTLGELNNIKDAKENSLMSIAATTDNYEMVSYLLKTLTLSEFEGYHSLMSAVQNNSFDTVKVLIDSHIDVSSYRQPKLSYGVLSFACINNSEIAKYLLKAELFQDELQEALILSSRWEKTDMIETLFEYNADINMDVGGNTPLIEAIFSGAKDSVKVLIELGASTNKESPMGTPLGEACYCGEYEIVKILIDSGSDINKCDDLNQTPMYYATYSGSLDIVKYLIEKGYRVTSEDVDNAIMFPSDNITAYLQSSLDETAVTNTAE